MPREKVQGCDAVDRDKLAQRFESRTHEYSSKTLADWSTLSKREADWRLRGWVRKESDKIEEKLQKTFIAFLSLRNL